MVYTRYRFASKFCRGRRVLEVACGPGVGLGYLAGQARDVVGGDVTDPLLQRARHRLQGAIPLVRLDAEALPLRPASRDVIICFEALYFFEHPAVFLNECRRVLGPHGCVILCTVNPEWPEFNPNVYGQRYHSARQLSALLRETGFHPDIFGAFPIGPTSGRAACLSWIKRVAVILRLIPSSMAGKRLLKRLVFGKLVPFPATVEDGIAAYAPPRSIPTDQPIAGYKIIFAVGRPA